MDNWFWEDEHKLVHKTLEVYVVLGSAETHFEVVETVPEDFDAIVNKHRSRQGLRKIAIFCEEGHVDRVNQIHVPGEVIRERGLGHNGLGVN